MTMIISAHESAVTSVVLDRIGMPSCIGFLIREYIIQDRDLNERRTFTLLHGVDGEPRLGICMYARYQASCARDAVALLLSDVKSAKERSWQESFRYALSIAPEPYRSVETWLRDGSNPIRANEMITTLLQAFKRRELVNTYEFWGLDEDGGGDGDLSKFLEDFGYLYNGGDASSA
jgi:hypothetical protein